MNSFWRWGPVCLWTIDKLDKLKEVNCSPSKQNSVCSTDREEKPKLKSLESSHESRPLLHSRVKGREIILIFWWNVGRGYPIANHRIPHKQDSEEFSKNMKLNNSSRMRNGIKMPKAVGPSGVSIDPLAALRIHNDFWLMITITSKSLILMPILIFHH